MKVHSKHLSLFVAEVRSVGIDLCCCSLGFYSDVEEFGALADDGLVNGKADGATSTMSATNRVYTIEATYQ